MREYQRNWYKITESHNWIKESSKSFETTTYLYPCHIRQFPWQVSGVTQSTRAANWRNQGTMISMIRRQVSMTPSRLEPLWQDTGDRSQPDPQSWQVSGIQSQPSRKSWQVSGHQVCRAANPGTHGPSVPETREAKSSVLT